jgi:peptidoglycan/xylan/chitin deacetylase (PgdA/CDA1 family)
MYHSVNTRFPYSIGPDAFEAQVRYVAENFDVLTLNEIGSLRANTASRIAVITFDDGYIDNYEIVLPILERYKLSATFFVCPGYVSGAVDITKQFRNYRDLAPMGWQHLRRMREAGMEIGAHSITHPVLSEVPRERKIEEITLSKRALEDNLGVRVDSFAYPYGYPWTFDGECEDIVRNEYRYCCTSEWGLNPVATVQGGSNLRLKRVRIDADDSIEDFICKLRGDWDYMAAVQRARAFFRGAMR